MTNNDDLKAYLATSEEEDSQEEEEEVEDIGSQESGLKTKDKINKYKDLLNSLNDAKEDRSEGNLEMEISWEPNLKDMAEDLVQQKRAKQRYVCF